MAVGDVALAGIAETDEKQHGITGSAFGPDEIVRQLYAASLLVGLRRRGGGGTATTRGGSTTGRSTWRSARRSTGSTFGAGRGTGGSSGGSSRSGGSGGFGGGLEFFRVDGRRHHRDQRDVAMGDHAHIRRQCHIAEMLGMVDVEVADIDVDRYGNRLGKARHLDGMGHDVDRAAALDAGRS